MLLKESSFYCCLCPCIHPSNGTNKQAYFYASVPALTKIAACSLLALCHFEMNSHSIPSSCSLKTGRVERLHVTIFISVGRGRLGPGLPFLAYLVCHEHRSKPKAATANLIHFTPSELEQSGQCSRLERVAKRWAGSWSIHCHFKGAQRCSSTQTLQVAKWLGFSRWRVFPGYLDISLDICFDLENVVG